MAGRYSSQGESGGGRNLDDDFQKDGPCCYRRRKLSWGKGAEECLNEGRQEQSSFVRTRFQDRP